jgi:beta-lactam-binding protein with PASTA domain
MREEREERVRSDATVVEERVEVDEAVLPPGEPVAPPPGGPVGPPPGEPELEQAVVRETETVRQREDGAIERDTIREEHRRRSRGSWAGILLALLALAAAGALGAWWYFTQADTTQVPAVEGMPLDRAVGTLQEDGLKADIVTRASDAPEGTVYRQDPAAGTEVDDGSSVQVLVSGGPSTKPVPNAVGMTEAAARDRLVAAGLEVRSREVFSDQAPGTVVSQDPAAGAQAADGASVTLAVSKGTGMVEVPNVVGLSRAEAEAELSTAKLEANVVEVPSSETAGTVVAQNPVAGQARQGSSVRLNVSQGG